MAIIKTYPLKSSYYGPDRIILSDMEPDAQGIVHGFTKNMTLSNLKNIIGSGASSFILRTVGSSGAATFDANTTILNIPDYSIGNVDGSGTAGRIPLWADSNTLGDSQIFQSGVNIGVGTTTPGFKLDVDGDTRTDCVWFRSNTATSPSSIAGFYRPSLGAVAYGYNTNEFFRIAADGKVGIGTTTPAAKLEVRDSTTDLQMRIGSLTAGISPFIRLQGKNTGDNTNYFSDIQLDAETGLLIFKDPGTSGGSIGQNPMVLNSSGYVGIGTTSPAANLDVLQEARISYAPGNQYRVRITNSDGNGRILVDGDTSSLIFGTSPAGTNATAVERMRIISTGNVGIGTTSPTSKLKILDAVDRDMNNNGTGQFEIGGNGYQFGIAMGDDTCALYTNSAARSLTLGTNETKRVEILGSGEVIFRGDGTNSSKTRFNCSANSHYVEVVGPDHSGGVSYSLKLPNTLPSVSNQILESNALGTLSWIATPSGGGGGGGSLNTVGLTMPSAFTVGNSPLTGTGGTISVSINPGSVGEYLDYQGNFEKPLSANPSSAASAVLTGLQVGATIYSIPQGTGNGTITAVSGQSGISGAFTSGAAVLTNSDRGTSQLFYRTFTTDNGSNVVASANQDTMQVIGGSGITTAGSADKISIALNLATSIERGGIQIGYVENGKNYPVELSGEKAYVNVPWTGGGGGGGISFSGATSEGLATFTNSSTAGVNSKVTLNANGLMDFDSDGNSAGSIDFDPTGTRLKIGDLSSGNSGIVEIFTNGARRFQIGLNGQIGVGTGASTGTSGQFLQSQGAGSPAIWSSSGAAGGSSGTSGMVQLADGSSGFTNSASLVWEIISGIKGKLVLGKNTGGAYDREGILRLVGGPNAAGTSGVGGTIELQSAVGKSGGSVASLKIQAPPSNSIDQEIVLPSALPTATNQILGISSISSSTVNTAWKTPAASNQPSLGFTPLSIYEANDLTVASYTYYVLLVCDVDITVTNAKVFVRSGTSPIYSALYSTTTGNMQSSGFTRLATFYKTTGVAVGVNILPLQEGTATLTAGQTIMLGFSSANQMAGGAAINSNIMGVQTTSLTTTFPASIASIENTTNALKRVSIHFYAS